MAATPRSGSELTSAQSMPCGRNVRFPEVFVKNAGEAMELWEVYRFHQIYRELVRSSGQGEAPILSAAERIRMLRDDCSRHRPIFERQLRLCRGQLPDVSFDELQDLLLSLQQMEVNGSAVLKGTAQPRDHMVLRLASYAGRYKAELAASVADAVLIPMGQTPRKQLDDLKAQIRMLLDDSNQRGKKLASEAKAPVLAQLGVRDARSVRMKLICTIHHQVPCVLWQPLRRDG